MTGARDPWKRPGELDRSDCDPMLWSLGTQSPQLVTLGSGVLSRGSVATSCEEVLSYMAYQFPVSAVTNCQKLGDLKQQTFPHSSGGQRSEIGITGPKSRCQDGLAPAGSSGGEPIPCLFRLLVAASILWLVDAFLQFSKPASSNLCPFHLHITFSSVCVKFPSASLS